MKNEKLRRLPLLQEKIAAAEVPVKKPQSFSPSQIARLSLDSLLGALRDWHVQFSPESLEMELRALLARACFNSSHSADSDPNFCDVFGHFLGLGCVRVQGGTL